MPGGFEGLLEGATWGKGFGVVCSRTFGGVGAGVGGGGGAGKTDDVDELRELGARACLL